VLNLTETIHENWEMELSGKSVWKEILNTDSKEFWGSGKIINKTILVEPVIAKEPIEENEKVNDAAVKTTKQATANMYKVSMRLPGLSAVILK
ncbi:MAG: alpha amylase C-terminal domain-containing protein, partial [Chitinophagaceae bacterium]